jgi:hypothetical protein
MEIKKRKTICVLLFTVLVISVYAQDIPTIDWDALQETKPWEKTEVWEPVPTKITAGTNTSPPSDAIILFDGSNLDLWRKPQFLNEGATSEIVQAMVHALQPSENKPADWIVKDGAFEVKPGSGAIETKQVFGDMQLHIEWLSPVDIEKEGQLYSNSGIFLMGIYEVQVLNSYENETYANGQAGSIYKQSMPMVNASRPPGEWQSYDIIFKAPKFDIRRKMTEKGNCTVFHNGVLIQYNVEISGPTAYIGDHTPIVHPAKLSLRLQDHGDKVRFRNIWVRELDL